MGEYGNYSEDDLRKGVREGKYNKKSVGEITNLWHEKYKSVT